MSDKEYVFFMGPGAQTDDVTLNTLLRAHETEAKRYDAEFTNFGWGTSEHTIESKTNKAKLYSRIDPRTMAVTHQWEPYWYRPIGDSPDERELLREYYKTDMDTENKRRREFADESARFVESIKLEPVQ